MYGSKITMGICKCWIDLYGPSVALKGALDILHLLQGVPHVAVRISKGGMYPGWRDEGKEWSVEEGLHVKH